MWDMGVTVLARGSEQVTTSALLSTRPLPQVPFPRPPRIYCPPFGPDIGCPATIGDRPEPGAAGDARRRRKARGPGRNTPFPDTEDSSVRRCARSVSLKMLLVSSD
eukprot:1435867-Rhodomonas_salina.2